MGGLGSGNRFQSGKRTTNDMLAIDIRYLQREGLLRANRLNALTWSRNGTPIADIKILAGDDNVRLIYKCREHGQEWEEKDYRVALDHTACYYGDCRVWFCCPCCHRRVAKLFGGAIFACRHCHNLNYESQRESDLDRFARKADKLRDRLGWEAGILNDSGWKPKGMHWKTFHRLEKQYNQIMQRVHIGIIGKFGSNW